ncbi:MAG: tetratricopeptide repeat protein [Chloroflexi bacterium]|nr:tetratricopeptide repeat protein [Chloroflexota bacterium]
MLTRQKLFARENLILWALTLLVLLAAGGFTTFYYLDRYTHSNERVLDRQARHLEEMVVKNPQNPDLRISVATYYLDSSMVDQAIQQGEEALKIDPKHQGAMMLLGKAYKQKKNYSAAVTQLTRVVELNRDNPLAKMSKPLEAVYYQLGVLYLEQGNYPPAVEALQAALAIDYTDADALHLLGLVYQKQTDHENAIRAFQEALRFDPGFVEPYQGLATSYAAVGKTQQAAYARAMVILWQGKYYDASKQLEGVLAQSPEIVQANYGLALAYEKLGRRDEAIAALNKFLKTYPNDIAAQQALGRISKGN